jgi:hypothetical protein
MAKVRKDEIGIYVRCNGSIARPGAVAGFSHACRMDDGGLKEGDAVNARPWSNSPLIVLTLSDGSKTRWHVDDSAVVREECPDGAIWNSNGFRL